MNVAELQILISIAKETKSGLDSLKSQVKDVNKELGEVGKQNSNLGEGLNKLNNHADNASKGVGELVEGMGHLKETVELAVKAFMGFEAVKIFFELAKDAAKDEALALGLRAVGANAGYAAGELKEATEALMKFGMTDEVASKNLSKLLSTGIPLDAAETLAKASRTLAQQSGQEVGRVYESMVGAVLTGRTRMLKMMGIKIDEAKIYREAQAANGGHSLTASQEGAAMTTAIAKEVEKKRGGFDEEGADLAMTKLNEISAAWTNLKPSVGGALQETFKGFLDMIKIVITALDDLWKSYQDGEEPTKVAGENTSTLGAMFKLLGETIAGLIYFFIENKTVITTLAGALLMIINPVGGAITIFSIFAVTSDRVKAALALLMGGIDLFLTSLGIVFMTTVGGAIAGLSSLMAMIKSGSIKEGMKLIDDYNNKLKEMTDHAKIAAGAMSGAGADLVKPGKTEAELAAEKAAKDKKDKDEAEKKAHELKLSEAEERAKKLAEAMIKANAQGAADRAKHEQNITKITTDEEDRRNKIKMEHGLMSDEQYWDAREQNLKKNQEKELASALAEQAKAGADAQAAMIAAGKKGGDPDKVAGENSIKLAEAGRKVEEVRAKQIAGTAKFQDDRDADQEKRAKARIKSTQALQEQTGQELAALKSKLAVEELDALKLTSDEQERKDISALYAIKRINGEADIRLKKERDLVDLHGKGLDLLQAQLDNRVKMGGLTDFEALKAKNEITSMRLASQQQLLAATEREFSGMAGNPEGAETLKKKAEIEALRAEIEKLKGSFESTGQAIRESFTSELDKALQGILTKTQTIGQALRSMGAALFTNMSQMVTKNLSQSITRSLTEATGGGNGIFGTIGKMLGGSEAPKGTPNDPIYMANANGWQDPAKDLAESVGQKFETITDNVGGSFNRMFGGLGTVLSTFARTIFSSSGGGGGGIFGFLSGLFGGGGGGASVTSGVPWAIHGAEGGLLQGLPHSQGGIKMEAEGGEYLIKNSQTRKWLPILQAINSGALDNLQGPRASKLPKFGNGGLVGDAGSGSAVGIGGQTNHVSIKIDNQGNATAEGQGGPKTADFARGLSQIVVQELLKQKRPGGLLA